MRELREDTFLGNKNDNAYEHVERPLDILEEVHNFKQEGDETLYQACKRYIDLLYKCPTYDLNSHQKVNIFYRRSTSSIDGQHLLQKENQIKPSPRDYSSKQWLKLKIRHKNVNKSIKNAMLNECVLYYFEEESETSKDLYSRILEEYNLGFDIEIKQLADEYALGIRNKGYILDDIWEKYEQVDGEPTYLWHDEGFEEEEERWKSALDEKYYEPPQVSVETFKVKQYSFEVEKSFICVTKQIEETLPLGWENGSSLLKQGDGTSRSPQLVVNGVKTVENYNYDVVGYLNYVEVRPKSQNFIFKTVTTV
nr:BYPASS-related protein [Tanacetum cinerariifolium]